MALEKLLKVQERLWAPEDLRKKANLQDYAAEYRKALDDPEGFWGLGRGASTGKSPLRRSLSGPSRSTAGSWAAPPTPSTTPWSGTWKGA